MKNLLKLLIVVILPLLLVGSTLASHLARSNEKTESVAIQNPQLQTIPRVTCLGRLEPRGEIINVAAPADLSGERIGDLYIKDGGFVKNGQIVACMESSNQAKAELNEAIEKISVAKAQLNRVLAGAKQGELKAQKSEINRLKLELEGKIRECDKIVERSKAQVTFDQNEYKRFYSLLSEGAVTTSQFDSKRLALESSQCRLIESISDRERLIRTLEAQINEANFTYEKIAEIRPCDIALAKAEVQAAIANAEKFRQDYELTLVRAPMDGQVLKVITKKGESSTNKTIFEMGDTSSMVAVAEVYESDVHKIKTGDIATIYGSALTRPVSGRVFDIGTKLIKQKVFSSQPGENFDDRVVETRILINKSDNNVVHNMTNAQVQISIKTRAGAKAGT